MDDSLDQPETTQEVDYGPQLMRLVGLVEDSVSDTDKSRNWSVLGRQFYDGQQYTPQELEAFKRLRLPDVVMNHIQPAINSITGVARNMQVDPRALPRNPGDEEAAEVATKVLRYISDVNRFDTVIRGDCLEDAVIGHAGAVIITWDEDTEDIGCERVKNEEFIWDAASREYDFSDARYLGRHRWAWIEDVAAMFPAKADKLRGAKDQSVAIDPAMDDKPRFQWADKGKTGGRIAVVELYHRERGVWMRSLFTRDCMLEHGESPLLDARGRPSCGVIAFSIYLDVDNNRYGPVQSMIPVQKEANKRRQKLLQHANNRQLMMIPDAIVDADMETARREAARPDGVIPVGYQPVPAGEMAAFQSQLLQDAKQHIDRLTPAPAVLGRQDANQSGRAIMARQQAGMQELSPVFVRLADWTLRCYRAMWARARQFYTDPKMIRITDDLKTVQMLQVNEPIVQMMPTIQPGPFGGTMIVEAPQVVGYKNRLADMQMDIIVDAMPDTASLQEEQFQGLAQMAANGLPIPPELLIRASSLPNKRELLDVLEQAKQQPNPDQQAEAQKGSAEADKLAAEAEYKKSQAAQIQQNMGMNAAAMAFNPMGPPPGMTGASPMATV
ncbi:MAG: hypothetical protein ING71_16695 [Rhodocyclaceae bacterium]|nr:hypothetical protein [Rhodocyclaceae bacterium]